MAYGYPMPPNVWMSDIEIPNYGALSRQKKLDEQKLTMNQAEIEDIPKTRENEARERAVKILDLKMKKRDAFLQDAFIKGTINNWDVEAMKPIMERGMGAEISYINPGEVTKKSIKSFKKALEQQFTNLKTDAEMDQLEKIKGWEKTVKIPTLSDEKLKVFKKAQNKGLDKLSPTERLLIGADKKTGELSENAAIDNLTQMAEFNGLDTPAVAESQKYFMELVTEGVERKQAFIETLDYIKELTGEMELEDKAGGYESPEDVKKAYKSGTLTRDEAKKILDLKWPK